MSHKTRPKHQKRGKQNNKSTGVRIIGGQWRGRRLPVADVDGLRPSSDRLRETLFNWLQPTIHGANCLDLFAGTGALSFEALSRGAEHAVLIESDRIAMQGLRQACETLSINNIQLHHSDALRLIETEPSLTFAPFDLLFIDPPWSISAQSMVLQNLINNGWLKPNALIYVELPKNSDFLPPSQLHEIKRKTVGEALALLYEYKKNQQ